MKPLIVIVFVLLISCNNETIDSNASADSSLNAATAEPAVELDCYTMVHNKDTAKMQLEVSGTVIKGSLQYSLHEKDSNKGTLQGIRRDQLLIADYRFEAEGMTSVRQIVFKIEGDSLREGYGDVDVKGDSVRFKNIDSLQFMKDRVFVKSECK